MEDNKLYKILRNCVLGTGIAALSATWGMYDGAKTERAELTPKIIKEYDRAEYEKFRADVAGLLADVNERKVKTLQEYIITLDKILDSNPNKESMKYLHSELNLMISQFKKEKK